jgi:hypothetical protein
MLAQAHALVDVERRVDRLSLEPLIAMSHGRPVLSARQEFAKLLEASPLPLQFPASDRRQLADRLKSLAAAWSEELDTAGQLLRDAAREAHSVVHWAEAVDSIVAFVRRHGQMGDDPESWEATTDTATFATNGSGAHTAPSERPESDGPEGTLNGDGRAEEASKVSSQDMTVGNSRWRRRRARPEGR